MVVAGPWFTRMMLNEPRRGLRVYGELYEVETNPLVSLDAIEHIGEPGNVREFNRRRSNRRRSMLYR
jgi:gamma-glutamylaminecyclotransferase